MATDESFFFFFFFWVLGKATDTKKELIRKVRSGRQDGWGVLPYPNGKQGLCQATGLFCQTAVQNAQTLAYNCHFREKKSLPLLTLQNEDRGWGGCVVESHVPSCSQRSSRGAGHPSL